MSRKFVQLTPIVNKRVGMELYAVADDGTAWVGVVEEGDVEWAQIVSLPDKERKASKTRAVRIGGLG